MKENNRPYTLNKVDGFNPYDYLKTSKSRGEEVLKEDGTSLQYLPADAKIKWFRMVYPKGAIITEVVETPQQDFGSVAKYKVSIYFDVSDPNPVVCWFHQETVWDVAEADRTDSKVEKVVVGKALSIAGFGCEIELALGIATEGDVETEAAPAPPATPPTPAPAEAPKKKRGRPKKEEVEASEADAANLLQEAENAAKQEQPEPASESVDESEELKKALATKIAITKEANIAVRQYEGKTIEQVLKDYPAFCKLAKSRAVIRKGLTEEVLKATDFVADHMK
jgi:hypothetical protein